MVHVLVAKAFMPNPNNFSQINHEDEDKTNNAVSNLEYSSARANKNFSTNKRSSSKYPGVSRRVSSSGRISWRARCVIENCQKSIGTFEREEDAAQAYVDFCNENNLIYKTDSQK